MRALNLEGQRYERLSVLGVAGTERGLRVWRCLCDCGTEVRVTSQQLRRKDPKRTRSCGCAKQRQMGPFICKGREKEYRREHRKKPSGKAQAASYARMKRATDPAYRSRQQASDRVRYRANPERRLGPVESKFVRRYGITIAQRDEMFQRQCGLCACCSAPMRFGRGGAAIDHNHDTGQVRAIVCGGCNGAIGALEGGYERLKLARAYLLRLEGDKSEPLP